MAIVKMKHLSLLAMRPDREAILHLLQGMGCVEVAEPSQEQRNQQLQELMPHLQGTEQEQWLTSPDASHLLEAQVQKQDAERAIGVLKHYGIKPSGMFSPKPKLTRSQLFAPDACTKGRNAVQTVLDTDRELSRLQGEQGRITALKHSLTPWLSLDVPLESHSTEDMLVQFGTISSAVPFDEVVRRLEAASELVQLTLASTDRDLSYCLLVCHKSCEDSIFEVLREVSWSRISMGEWTGTAKENDARLYEQLQVLDSEIEQLQEKLSGMGDLLPELCQASDRASITINREENRTRLLDTQQTFLLDGWVPAERWSEVEKQLSLYPCAWDVTDPKEEDYGSVPVKLKNNWFTKPLSMVTEMYSLPAYGGIDPNPLMAPFFILFYGIMMADMGYGLLMMLASVIVLKKAQPKGGMYNFFALLGLCGISTFVMGALTGGFFGDFIPQLLKLMNPESTFVWFWPTLFTPLEDTLLILVGSMALGLVQIITGMAVSFVRKIQAGNVLDAVFEELTWWIVFVGIGLMAANITPVILYAGLVMVVLGPILTQQGAGKITGIFASLYNHVTGYFGDILSYSRLMALMLAGSVIAQVFNTLGAIPGNILIFILISIVGNGLNFALNLLGCYVHDLRLQCLEYFNKFYEDGGTPFRPMEMKTNYYEIVES